MISQIYLVEYGSYIGYASTYEEAIELEKRYKTYTEDSGAISNTANEMHGYIDKHKQTVLKSDGCLSASRKESEPKGWSNIFGYGKHKAPILNCVDLSSYQNAK